MLIKHLRSKNSPFEKSVWQEEAISWAVFTKIMKIFLSFISMATGEGDMVKSRQKYETRWPKVTCCRYNTLQLPLNIHRKDWCWSWSSNTLATWSEEPTHWKRPGCWERLRAGGEGDDRAWDGWMGSPTQWTWVWVDSRSWWWTGKPGVLQSMGSQKVGLDWATELNWTEHYSKSRNVIVIFSTFFLLTVNFPIA